MNNLNTEEKVGDYNLVDYGKKVPLALITKESKVNSNQKVFRFTDKEAHDLNYAFALNRAGKRYVKEYSTIEGCIRQSMELQIENSG
jgi:hypothetical protein